MLAAVGTHREIQIGPWYFVMVLRCSWNVPCQIQSKEVQENDAPLRDARPRTP